MTRPSEQSRGRQSVPPTNHPESVGETLKALSKPWPAGERKKSAIDRAARLAGLTYTRAWDIWYGKARRIEDHEAQAIEEAIRQKLALEAQNELAQLRLQLTRIESLLALSNPNMDRANTHAHRGALRSAR